MSYANIKPGFSLRLCKRQFLLYTHLLLSYPTASVAFLKIFNSDHQGGLCGLTLQQWWSTDHTLITMARSLPKGASHPLVQSSLPVVPSWLKQKSWWVEGSTWMLRTLQYKTPVQQKRIHSYQICICLFITYTSVNTIIVLCMDIFIMHY